ncbi:hypothetical protein JZU46_04860 [bacterium]|jgi:hypothetical protein|nr:hypothetical protein [bacterium]
MLFLNLFKAKQYRLNPISYTFKMAKVASLAWVRNTIWASHRHTTLCKPEPYAAQA